MKIIKLFSDAFVVIIITASIILLLPNMLKAAGINSFVILSGSMEPLIHTGSVVMVDSREKDIEVGDIIMYRL
ncbi:MAG: S26 family signal peptidase, partial [Frisingicoccus sp.]|nr:S26 family signal peptidase [Frisingicoccus sp.]